MHQYSVLISFCISLSPAAVLARRDFRLKRMVEVLLMAAILAMALRFSSLFFSMGILLAAACYLLVAGAAFIYGNLIFHLGRPLLMLDGRPFAVSGHIYNLLIYFHLNRYYFVFSVLTS